MRSHSPQHRDSRPPISTGAGETTTQHIPVASSLRREGEFWIIDYQGDLLHLRDSKGLLYLAQLLINPGKELQALELYAIGGGTGELPAHDASGWQQFSTIAAADAGELLDQRAQYAYRSRIHELRSELTEGVAHTDLARAEAIETELDSLTRELRRAVGLGGRSRRAGSALERARINVTRTIRAAIERIRRRNSELGSNLAASIATGNVCCYTPRDSVIWELDTASRGSATTSTHGGHARSTIQWRASRFSRRTTFIGREEELSALRAILTQAVQGSGQLTLIGGSAGVGKTRLAAELGEYATALGAQVAIGRCDERQNGLAYLPFAEILEAIFESAKGPDGLREMLGSEAADIARLVPQVHRSIQDLESPSQLPTEQARRALFIAVGDLLARVGRAKPLVLIIDDLQWADESSMLLLIYLMRRLSKMRVLALATFRNVDLDVNSGFAHTLEEVLRDRTVQVLLLDGLALESCAMMLQELSGQSPPAALLSTFLHQTEGNPLFIEELFKHLDEEKVLFDAAGQFRPLKLNEISVPRNLRLVLQRRLNRLDRATRATLAVSAVIGRTFTYELLQSLAAGTAEALLDQIDTAERVGLIRSASGQPGSQLEFSHELIRQTLLADISLPRRQHLHLAVANAIERSHSDSVAENAPDLAHHLYMAGASAEPERTIRYFRVAARQMVERFAYSEALGLLSSSLELLPRVQPRVKRLALELTIRHEMSVPLLASRGFSSPELRASTARILELCRKVEDPGCVFAALAGVWNFSLDGGDLGHAGETANWLMALAMDSTVPMRTVIANYAAGSTMFFRGELQRARAHFEHAASLYLPADHAALDSSFVSDPGVISLAHGALTLWRLGLPDQALSTCDRAVALAREIAHPSSLAHALFHAAEIRQFRGDFAGAIEMATGSIELSASSGLSYWLGLATAARGAALVRTNHFETGIAEVMKGVEIFHSTGTDLDLTYAMRIVAEASLVVSRPEEALAAVDRSLAAVESSNVRLEQPELERLRGEAILMRSSNGSEEAEDCFKRSLEVARRQNAKSWELRTAMSLTRLLRQQGRGSESGATLAEIYGWFTEGFDTADLRDAKVLLVARCS